MKKIGSIAVVGLFVLLYGDAIFSNLKYLPDGPMELLHNIQNSIKYNDINIKNTIYGILGNFQLSALSLNVAFDVINDYNFSYRFFSDVIYGFLSLIPEVLTGISVPETIAYHNTYYIKGEFISNIPPGMLGFAIYSMGWAGLFLFSYIWGWIGSFINRLLSNNMDNHYWIYPLYVLTAMDWSIASSGEPRLFFQSKFILLVIAYYLLFVSNKCFKKKNNIRRIDD
ncbi:hypothetical protein [uncultured Ilyobacter sp.]|uniref:hypothetical protein n=1 Tax=uncultured Ilyobacter sp. TaxID=544433 RepID=UPI002AA7F94B|nr:hypothetical protein [uncultured Ilyobacter sp.]